MIGHLKCLTVDPNGSQNITLTVRADFRAEFDRLHGQDVEITIDKLKKSRSSEANRMLWRLCTEIAKRTGVTKEDIYRESIRRVGEYAPLSIKEEAVDAFAEQWTSRGKGWIFEVVDDSEEEGCKLCFAYYGSSKYDSKTMSRLIDDLIQEARDVGVDLLSDQERSLLLDSTGS